MLLARVEFLFPVVLPEPRVATPVFVFVLLLLFLLSFLISGAQEAFFSLSNKDVNMLKTREQASYKRIVDLLEKPKSLMAALIIAQTIISIAIVLIANMLLDVAFLDAEVQPALFTVARITAITLALVLFAQILPRVWATSHKIWFASTAGMVVEIFYLLFLRISNGMVKMGEGIENALGSTTSTTQNSHLDDAIDLLPDHEATAEEKQLLKGVRKFGNTTAKQTMKTRQDISAVSVEASFEDILDKVKRLKYSRLPVYRKNLDTIEGMLHTKDLLPFISQPPDFDWQKLMRPVFYIHEHKLIEDLLQDFRNRHIHIAVVVDEFGGTSGIITLEDIMEEIIGDIQDEFDNEESENKKIDEYNYIFEGRTMINDFCRKLDLNPATFERVRGESDSLAGLILEIAGDFPPENQEVRYDGFTFIPLVIDKNRIEKIKVTLAPPEA